MTIVIKSGGCRWCEIEPGSKALWVTSINYAMYKSKLNGNYQ